MIKILFDIGGSKTRVAWTKDGQHFVDPVIQTTVHHPTHGPHAFIDLIEQVAAGRPIQSISGGIAGTLDQDNTKLVSSHHLSEWEHYPLVGTLSSHFHCPVHIENDTAVVGLGETHFGAGRDNDIVVYITISTGVGGVRIVHGQIDTNTYGFEPGHHILNHETGDTFENLVSGSANEKRYDTNIIDIPTEAWDTLAKQAAIGIYNAALFWSPDCIVLGGSMIVKPIGIKIEAIKAAYNKLPQIFPKNPKIVQAKLEDLGGLYGAMVV